jgi:hypothetical protein
MCKVSDQIKFCTCDIDNLEELTNYWIFYRYHRDKNEIIVGSYMFPVRWNPAIVEHNEATLLKRINESDAFDTDLRPKYKDRLEIVLHWKDANDTAPEDLFNGPLHLGFEFKKGKWQPCTYDYFEWVKKHEEEVAGILED